MAFRFIHIADVHFDTPFESRSLENRKMLREGIRAAFERSVDIAISSQVNCVLIAGDLFDNDTLSFATEGFIIKQMNRLKEAGIDAFYATGNHDPGGAVYKAKRIKWPSNVHVFDESQPVRIPVNNCEGQAVAYVVGAGHDNPREGRNLAQLFPYKEGELPWIGILHTDVVGCTKGDEERYAPCSLKDLTDKGYSYWALGHIHRRQVLCNDPPVIYPGNIMGRNPREDGPKGIYMVEIEQNRVKQEFIPVAPVIWQLIRIDNIKEADNLESLKDTIRSTVNEAQEELNGERRLLRIVLEGQTPLYDELQSDDNLEALEHELEQELNVDGVQIKSEQVESCANPEDYIGQVHVLGETLKILQELKDNPEGLLDILDTKLAMESPKWSKEQKQEYLLGLLKDMDVEITSRMAGGVQK